jgi:hypothetical protein
MHDEQQDGTQPPAGIPAREPDDPRQRSLDFVRGEQLRLLQDCELPREAKDKTGHGVRAVALKSVLHAIDTFGRGRSGGAYASVRTLAATANMGPRTCTRAIEVLQQLGLVCVTNDGPRYGHRGSPTNRYTIVWSELAVLVDRYELTHPKALRPAPRSERPGDRSERPGDRSERPGDRSERPGGAQNDTSNVYEAYVKRRRDVCRDGARDFDQEGGREFTEDEVAAVRARANKINCEAQARTLADRELVLKLAVLWEDGDIPEDAIEQTLESYSKARDKGQRINSTMGWLWTTIRNQCWRYSFKLEPLLVATHFPQELLTPPAARAAAPT